MEKVMTAQVMLQIYSILFINKNIRQDYSCRRCAVGKYEKTEKEKNWEDDFNVSIDTKEFIYWLDNIAFK